jgi:hypothetical protein
LYVGRQTRLRAKEGRRGAAKAQKRTEDGEYAGLLERDSKRAREAQRRAEEDQYTRLPEDMRKTCETQRRAEEEDFPRLLEEDKRRPGIREAQRRGEAEEAARGLGGTPQAR